MAAIRSSSAAFLAAAAGSFSAAVVDWPVNVSGCSEMVGGAFFRLLFTVFLLPPVELSVALPLELTELFLGFFFFLLDSFLRQIFQNIGNFWVEIYRLRLAQIPGVSWWVTSAIDHDSNRT